MMFENRPVEKKLVFVNGMLKGEVYGKMYSSSPRIERFHLFRRYNSINESVTALRIARHFGATWVKIPMTWDDGEREEFKVPLEIFEKSDLFHDNDGDVQKCVPVNMLRRKYILENIQPTKGNSINTTLESFVRR